MLDDESVADALVDPEPLADIVTVCVLDRVGLEVCVFVPVVDADVVALAEPEFVGDVDGNCVPVAVAVLEEVPVDVAEVVCVPLAEAVPVVVPVVVLDVVSELVPVEVSEAVGDVVPVDVGVLVCVPLMEALCVDVGDTELVGVVDDEAVFDAVLDGVAVDVAVLDDVGVWLAVMDGVAVWLPLGDARLLRQLASHRIAVMRCPPCCATITCATPDAFHTATPGDSLSQLAQRCLLKCTFLCPEMPAPRPQP
jgi:hypothetical protein